MYGIVVPALKKLARAEPGSRMAVEEFLELLCVREDLLNALVSNNIVSAVQGTVKFQSRAAQFYVDQLPPPAAGQRTGWFWWLGGTTAKE